MASSATVGTAVIKLTFDGGGVKAQLNGMTQSIESAGKTSGGKWGSAWAVAAGSLISKGLSKVSSVISNSMSSAISRIDTLNNFPRVMQSMGHSAEESTSSVNKISDALDGLPSTLDGVVGDVQKLAATMGNLDQGMVNATSVGLGLNDMFLAGGKGTEAASAAMEQYNQMLANGKVDMQSWRSMVNAAPGQMDQLSKTILGASANQADLYKAMQAGTVSFEQFNEAIVKLDKEGGAGFDSFYDQAVVATDGVETQLQNIGASLNKIIGGALQGNLEDVEKYTQQLAQRIGKVAPTLIKGFTGAFGSLVKAIPQIFTEILPSLIEGIQSLLVALVESLPLFAQAIVDAIPLIIDGIMFLLTKILEMAPVIIPQLIQTITNGIILLAQTLTLPENLTLIMQAALTLFLEIVKCLPQIIVSLINALPTIIENIVAFLIDPGNIGMIIDAAIQLFMGLVMAVPQILGALLGAFGTLVGNLWNGITSMFGQFASNFGNFIGGIFKNAINGVISFIENFINGPIDLLNGFIGVINDQFGWIGVHIDPIGRVTLPRLAQGGVVNSATTAIIGEAGKEAVIPLENNTDNWAGLLASTLATEMQEQDYDGKTINVYMTNEINSELDAQDIGRIMMQSIRRAA